MDPILLLDRDMIEQMIGTIAQKIKEIHMFKAPAQVVQIIRAENDRDPAGGALSDGSCFMNLVFPDQNHTSRIDDIRRILNKIATGAFNFIIDFILVVRVKGCHFISARTVNFLNIKIQFRRISAIHICVISLSSCFRDAVPLFSIIAHFLSFFKTFFGSFS